MNTVNEAVAEETEVTTDQEVKASPDQNAKPAEKNDEALETDGISCCGSCSG